MQYYVEIQVRDVSELSKHVIMNMVFSKLHLALVSTGQGQIGISFPDVDRTLGSRLRLHGSREALDRLMSLVWAKGLCDYANISEIRPVPPTCKHRRVARSQTKSSVDRLYRRSVKKGWCSEKKALQLASQHVPQLDNAPYLNISSKSSGQQFRLFIKHGPVEDFPLEGSFSSYGLSSVATVPWF